MKSKHSPKPGRAGGNRKFYMALGGVFVVGLALVGWSVTRPKPSFQLTDVKVTADQAKGYVYGNPNAPVNIIEFGDFECPMCGQFSIVTEPDVRKLILDKGLAKLTFYDFPLIEIHRNTVPASLAAACASEQGKFWPMHDRLFEGQLEWNGEATDNPKKVFQRYAKELGLDTQQWEQCYDSRKELPRVMANRAEAERQHLGGTPTFIIGNKMFDRMLSYDEIKSYVNQAAAQMAMQSAAQPDSQAKAAPKR